MYSSQKRETNRIYINGWTDEFYPLNGILFAYRNKWCMGPRYNMDDSEKIMLYQCEVNHKEQGHRIPFIWKPWVGKSVETESKLMVSQG